MKTASFHVKMPVFMKDHLPGMVTPMFKVLVAVDAGMNFGGKYGNCFKFWYTVHAPYKLSLLFQCKIQVKLLKNDWVRLRIQFSSGKQNA